MKRDDDLAAGAAPSNEFADLAGEATRVDNNNDAAGAEAAPGDAPGPEAQPKIDYAAVLTDLLNTAAGTVGVAVPFIPAHFTPKQNALIAQSWIALAEAYDLDLSKLLGRLTLWLMAVSVTGMPAVGCYAEWTKTKAAPAQPAGELATTAATSTTAKTQ